MPGSYARPGPTTVKAILARPILRRWRSHDKRRSHCRRARCFVWALRRRAGRAGRRAPGCCCTHGEPPHSDAAPAVVGPRARLRRRRALRRPPPLPPQRALVLARRPPARLRARLRHRRRPRARRAASAPASSAARPPAAADQARLQPRPVRARRLRRRRHRARCSPARRRARSPRPGSAVLVATQISGALTIVLRSARAISLTEGSLSRTSSRQMFAMDLARDGDQLELALAAALDRRPPTRARVPLLLVPALTVFARLPRVRLPSASATSGSSSSTRPTARCRARPRSPRRSRACSRARWRRSAPSVAEIILFGADGSRRCARRSARATTRRSMEPIDARVAEELRALVDARTARSSALDAAVRRRARCARYLAGARRPPRDARDAARRGRA